MKFSTLTSHYNRDIGSFMIEGKADGSEIEDIEAVAEALVSAFPKGTVDMACGDDTYIDFGYRKGRTDLEEIKEVYKAVKKEVKNRK